MSPEDTKKLEQIVPDILSKLSELPDNPRPDKKGGVLTIVERQTGMAVFIKPVGTIPDEKLAKYIRLSMEKAMSLRLLKPNDLSSWQSRDPKKDQWGGAIVAGEYIVSFSGLTEAGDEALALEVALQLNWINWHEAVTIAELSKNKLFDSLHEKMG